MEKNFLNKVVIVTGAASGIGRATALAFAKRGAKVVLADFRDAGETLSLIKQESGEAIYVKCDVSKEEYVKAMIDFTVKTYGSINFAVNNAGIEGAVAPMQDISSEDWDRTININLKGVWLCMKYEIPYMLKNPNSAIVNMASVAGMVAFANSAPYVASKHGVIGLTKNAAIENAKTGIRVNAICPGIIYTSMIERYVKDNPGAKAMLEAGEPVGRMGKPEEIAEAAVWLCSDAASFITGAAIPVDGGWVVQ